MRYRSKEQVLPEACQFMEVHVVLQLNLDHRFYIYVASKMSFGKATGMMAAELKDNKKEMKNGENGQT